MRRSTRLGRIVLVGIAVLLASCSENTSRVDGAPGGRDGGVVDSDASASPADGRSDTHIDTAIADSATDISIDDAPQEASGALQSEVTIHGITWTFDQPYLVGLYANGDWWVLDPGTGVQVSAVAPAPSGAAATFRHGSMVNPLGVAAQGYDGRVRDYDPALSVSFPVTLAAGESLVSTQSRGDEKTSDCWDPNLLADVTGYCVEPGHGFVLRAAVLTAVATPPPIDAFRPPFVGTVKPMHRTASLDLTLLPRLSLANPPSSARVAQVAGMLRHPWLDHKSGWTGRMMHPMLNMPNYGREFGTLASEASVLLMLSYGDEELGHLAMHLVQVGIDLYAMAQNGTSWPGQGGHGHGRKWLIVLAGLLLGDQPMQTVNRTFGEDGATYYGTEASNNPGQAHVALYGEGCTSDYQANGCSGGGAKECRDPAGVIDACPDYRNCCSSHTWVGQALSARILGVQAIWNHDALFDYVDRWMAYGDDPPVVGGGSTGPAVVGALWNSHRSTF